MLQSIKDSNAVRSPYPKAMFSRERTEREANIVKFARNHNATRDGDVNNLRQK